MNSINEAAHAGKPMVVIPLFNDQLYNAALVKAKGIGEHVEIRSTTNPQFLINALSKVLNDPSYSKNVQVLRRKLELTPFSSAERLVKWVEFAAQFPGQLTELNLPNTDELGCAMKVMKQEKIMNLIETVRRYPFLYDKGHEDFKDAVKKNARWLEIGKELELNGRFLFCKFTTISENFAKI
ncbi:UDP-glucoronosyl and UDP-glucosyl transferase domain-containing protein [Ditylenchus destructor]|nr:UDP-glucoronosyl and UDP-glucosyl transferase domain-containing protein [Ditylenchus destructor]